MMLLVVMYIFKERKMGENQTCTERMHSSKVFLAELVVVRISTPDSLAYTTSWLLATNDSPTPFKSSRTCEDRFSNSPQQAGS